MNGPAVSLSNVASPEGFGATLTGVGLAALSLQGGWPTTTAGWVAFGVTMLMAVSKALTK